MFPTDIKLHKRTAVLELTYKDGGIYTLPAEYLRVHSPSAEVRGHGIGQEILQVGKIDVKIDNIEPIGNYAIRLHFNDDHDTGIYTWDYLRELSLQQAERWQAYLQKLQHAGERREVLAEDTQVVKIFDLNQVQ